MDFFKKYIYVNFEETVYNSDSESVGNMFNFLSESILKQSFYLEVKANELKVKKKIFVDRLVNSDDEVFLTLRQALQR